MTTALRAAIGVGSAVLTVVPAAWFVAQGAGHQATSATPAPLVGPVDPTPPAPTEPAPTEPTPASEPTPEFPPSGGPALPTGPDTAAASSSPVPAPPPVAAAPVPAAPPSGRMSAAAAPEATGRPAAQNPAPKPPPPKPAAAPRAAESGCTANPGPISPTRFQVPRMGVNAPMVTVGKDKDGNPGSPPLSQLFSTAWYQGSPAPGSARGNVIINVHSYASGSALGNDLRTGLRPGDLIKVPGANGKVACYRFREAITIRVATYNPRSGLYQNPTGRPQLAIMTCWDRNPRTGEYDSRILFYADPVAA